TDLANLGSTGALVKYNLQLARYHLPLCVSIQDSDCLAEARLTARDASNLYRRVVASELVAEAETVLAKLQNSGVLTVHVPADTLSTAAVSRYLEIKYRGLL
ncbi:MAG: DUF58 domain-containing protein, partial [Planctomycetes bacterium]|nr:DUF58 domain-containing protein [Planctomycetota bacterium]